MQNLMKLQFAEEKHLEFGTIEKIGNFIQTDNFEEQPVIVVIIAGLLPNTDLPLEIFERDLDMVLEKEIDLGKIQWQQKIL